MKLLQLSKNILIALLWAYVTCSTANAGGIAQAAAKAAVNRAFLAKQSARAATLNTARSKTAQTWTRTIATRKPAEMAVSKMSGKVGATSLGKPNVPIKSVAQAGKPVQVAISRSRYPESAAHIRDAQRLGQPSILTIHKQGAMARRKDSLRYIPRRAGYPIAGRDRDEYPFAMTREGGFNSSVRYIKASDNRGAGKSFERQVRGLPDGTRVRIHVSD